MVNLGQALPESQSFTVICTEFRAFAKNSLIGFATLTITPPGLSLHGCTLHVRGEDGKSWIGLPAKEYLKRDGEKSWVRIVDFEDKPAYFKFQSLAMKAIASFRESKT